MSCFHGLQVESSFSVMNDIIDVISGNVNMETFDAYQTIKYGLSAVGKTATKFFKKDDILQDSVKRYLTKNFNANSIWRKKLHGKQKAE